MSPRPEVLGEAPGRALLASGCTANPLSQGISRRYFSFCPSLAAARRAFRPMVKLFFPSYQTLLWICVDFLNKKALRSFDQHSHSSQGERRRQGCRTAGFGESLFCSSGAGTGIAMLLPGKGLLIKATFPLASRTKRHVGGAWKACAARLSSVSIEMRTSVLQSRQAPVPRDGGLPASAGCR